MKTSQLISLSTLATLVLAQNLQSLPDCGKLCVNNMLAKARELGCADGDAACLCRNIDFAYGIRDCSTAVCGPQQAAPVIAYGENYCKTANNGNANGSPPVLPPSPSVTPNVSPPKPTITGQSTQNTSPLVTVITSGTEVYTSTIGTVVSSHSGSTSSATLDDIHKSSTGTQSSVTSSQSTATSPSTSTSSGIAAKQTTIAGLAAAAGLAAMIL